MKTLSHPNIVALFEVIDDPEKDCLYLVKLPRSFRTRARAPPAADASMRHRVTHIGAASSRAPS